MMYSKNLVATLAGALLLVSLSACSKMKKPPSPIPAAKSR